MNLPKPGTTRTQPAAGSSSVRKQEMPQGLEELPGGHPVGQALPQIIAVDQVPDPAEERIRADAEGRGEHGRQARMARQQAEETAQG
jgi:hypothetical protein